MRHTILSATALILISIVPSAQANNKEVVGKAESSYPLWSMPSDTLYANLEMQADKDAENQCNSTAVRISEYTEFEQFEQSLSGHMNVYVSATYQCNPKLSTNPLNCFSKCMEQESFNFCHAQCNMW